MPHCGAECNKDIYFGYLQSWYFEYSYSAPINKPEGSRLTPLLPEIGVEWIGQEKMKDKRVNSPYKPCSQGNPYQIGSLSKGVFERRTATGNETFSLFTRLSATTFVILSVVTRIETIYLKIRAHPLPKNEKRPLPVAVRRSKSLFLDQVQVQVQVYY